jgi:ATP-dependent DNA ligase
MRMVETFPDGDILLERCDRYGFEGVVSKRLVSIYASGPCKAWMKTKCPQSKRDNAEHFALFER